MDTTVSATLLHAITYLLTPLKGHYAPQSIDALHVSLLSLLTVPHTLLLSPSAPTPPVIQRALTQISSTLPQHLRVRWSDWVLLLTNANQVVLTIAPGNVSAAVRHGKTGSVDFTTVWDAAAMRAPSPWGPSLRSRSSATSSGSESESQSSRSSSPVSADDVDDASSVVAYGAAQTVLDGEYDDEEDENALVFGMAGLGLRRGTATPGMMKAMALAATQNHHKLQMQQQQHLQPTYDGRRSSLSAAAPEWFPVTGTIKAHAARPTHHPKMSMAASSMSSFAPSIPTISTTPSPTPQNRFLPTPVGSHRQAHGHSRSSSRTSNLSLAPPSVPHAGAIVPPSPTPSDISEGAMDNAQAYIDGSKDQLAVTEYECGKVGVLTGAVMLGVPKVSVGGGWKQQARR